MPEAAVKRRKSDRRQRSGLVQVRVTEAEAAEFERRAEAAGFQTVADFIRARCIAAQPTRARLDVVQLLKVEAAVNRVGNNVNQVTAGVHRRDLVTGADLAVLADALATIHDLIDGLHPSRAR